jgi:hypothetical protein
MKLQIKLGSNDNKFSIPLISRNNMLGYDDNVQNIVNAETNKAINTVSDGEVRRVSIMNTYGVTFNFWNGSSYVPEVAPLEFTSINSGSTELKSSFYIIQLYDTFVGSTQTKYHTGYYNGYEFTASATPLNSIYTNALSSESEFSDLYLSQNLLESITGATKDYYVKFSFYSGKSGKFYSFYNQANSSLTTEEKLYNKITVIPYNNTNVNSLKYSFNVGSLVLNELRNADYNTLINNTVPSFPVQKTTYPTGNTFTNDGIYITN